MQLHKCGYFARAECVNDEELRVVITLEGAPNNVEPLVVWSAPYTDETPPIQGMYLMVATAMCYYLNLGGDAQGLQEALDRVATLPNLRLAEDKLFAVIPSGEGPTVFLQHNEKYLRVVLGDEGFSEELSAQQVKEVIGCDPNSI